MKFKNICIKNEKLNFQDVNLDFSECGIYFIQGMNGAGKTTLLEHLIFGKNKVEFHNKEQEQLYKRDRGRLFAYVAQTSYSYKTSVLDYVSKGNSSIDFEQLQQYRKRFFIEDIALEEDVSRLSGGEKIKIAIMSALLKDTPYIFLDEPTNHMDEEAIGVFAEIVEELASERTFLIVCHDKRFQERLQGAQVIELAKQSIKQEESIALIEKKANDYNQNRMKKSYRIFLRYTNFNKMNLISLYIFVIAMVFLVVFNEEEFRRGYSDGDRQSCEDVILTYKAEYTYTRTNEVYAKAKKIAIREEDYQRFITYKDIEKIACIEGIEKIILEDEEQLFMRLENISQELSVQSIHVFAIPEVAIKEFANNYGAYLVGFGNLKYGRYPNDEKNEICLSKQLLEEYFQREVTTEEDAIGQSVTYNHKTYKLVGILDNQYNMCLVSFCPNENYGFYEYNAKTWKEFSKNVDMDSGTVSALIYTKKGMEERVFDTLFQSYPAENYSSKVFSNYWIRQHNIDFVLHSVCPMNLILAVLFGIIMLLVRSKQIKLDQEILRDYRNYYLERGKTKRLYKISIIIQSGLAISIALLANVLYSNLSYASNYILLVDGLLIFVPSILFSFRKLKNVI